MQSSIKTNYIYSVIYRIFIMVIPLIVTPHVARVLSVADNGLYAFSTTVALYLTLFGKLGLDHYGSRSIAFYQDDIKKRSQVFFGIYIMQVISSLIAITLYIASIYLFFLEDHLIYWIQLIFVGSILFDISWFFYGMEMFKLTTIRSLLSRGIPIALVFVFVKDKDDLPVFTFLMALSFLLEQLFLFPFVFRYVQKVRVSWKSVAEHILPNLKLFYPLLALSVFHWMNKIILGAMVDNDSVAYYTYAEYLINAPKGFVIALGTVMLPKVTAMVAQNQIDACKQTLVQSMKLTGFISCALCFGIAAVSSTFVPLFFGSRYEPTILLTLELAIVMIPMSITEVAQSLYLIPFKLEHIYIRSVALGAVISVLLNLVLIKYFGASGTVIATLAAEVAVCAYQIIKIRDVYSARQLLDDFGLFILCGLIMFAGVFTLRNLDIQPVLLVLLQVTVGGVLYLASCLLIFRVLRKTNYVYDILTSLIRKDRRQAVVLAEGSETRV